MRNNKHYNYFKTDKKTCEDMLLKFNNEISIKRDEILEELMAKTGCIAWRERNSWGKGSYICELVYPVGHEILSEQHIKIESQQFYEGKQVVCVRGKGNRKAGKKFNAVINEYNKRLEECPKFTDWIIEYFGVMRTGMGEISESGFGVSMLSTYGGTATDESSLLFAIPNDESEKHGNIKIPSCFEKITYGQFYDLINEE